MGRCPKPRQKTFCKKFFGFSKTLPKSNLYGYSITYINIFGEVLGGVEPFFKRVPQKKSQFAENWDEKFRGTTQLPTNVGTLSPYNVGRTDLAT